MDIHESMVEVLENENEMTNFKKEFMALVDKYCQPEVAYDVYSDKDLEEEAKWEEEYKRELLKDIQQDKEITEQYYSEKPSVVDMLSGKAVMEDVPVRIVNVVGAKNKEE